jgi:hypothetical protein
MAGLQNVQCPELAESVSRENFPIAAIGLSFANAGERQLWPMT